MSTENGVIKSYSIKASYIEKDPNSGDRKFQIELSEFFNDEKKRVAVLHAPTGSGKTYAFRKLVSEDNDNRKVMIVLPNNLLSAEVCNDLGQDAAVLSGESIVRERDWRKIEFDPHQNTSAESIEGLILIHKYIITNPTVFLYLLNNHYSGNSKEDMLTTLIKRRVTTVVFDEFHIYSKDQISMILAASLILPQRIKIVFSSATPQSFFVELCRELFDEDEVEDISIERLYEKTSKSTLLQGPIEFNVADISAEDFVLKNLGLFKNGNWMFILDSIKNVYNVGECLKNRYSDEEIGVVSAYIDPTYETYKQLKNSEKSKRILISTNIVEQGINIGEGYSNFVIEPGMRLNNTIQRTGRVGRGIEEESIIYLCFSQKMPPFYDKVETIDELIQVLKKLRYLDEERPPKPFGIGIYCAILMSKLSYNARNTIKDNILEYSNNAIKAGIACFENVDSWLNDKEGRKKLKRNCLREIDKVFTWFQSYKETFKNIIPPQDEVEICDRNFTESPFQTKYRKDWVYKNKEILKKGLVFTVGEFREKVNYDFQVNVKNLPEGAKLMKYGDIFFKAWSEIYNGLNSLLTDFMCEENEKVKKLMEDIRQIAKHTAGIERIDMEVIDDS